MQLILLQFVYRRIVILIELNTDYIDVMYNCSGRGLNFYS